MKIAVISKDYKDFLSHEKCSENEYFCICDTHDFMGMEFNKVEHAPLSSRNIKAPMLDYWCKLRIIVNGKRSIEHLEQTDQEKELFNNLTVEGKIKWNNANEMQRLGHISAIEVELIRKKLLNNRLN